MEELCRKLIGLLSSFAESDLERLPAASRDLQRFLQHKCYSKLTGEDRELFPDLKLIDNGDDVDDHDEAEEKQTFSVDVADTQVIVTNL